MAESMTAKDLLARLQRHYIKPGDAQPGGVFLDEVTHGRQGGRRADAIYVGFFASRGRLAHGHEIKVSRADWMTELDHPEKGDAWINDCHTWHVVAPSTSIVKPEELPHGWGLMVPSTRTTTRMDVIVKAEVHPDRQMSWEGAHSLIQRMDSIGLVRHGGVVATAETMLSGVEQYLGLPYAKTSGTTTHRKRLDAVEAEAMRLRAIGGGNLGERLSKSEALLADLYAVLGVTRVLDGDRPFRYGNSRDVSLDELRTSFAAWLNADMAIADAIGYRAGAVAHAKQQLLGLVEALGEVEQIIPTALGVSRETVPE